MPLISIIVPVYNVEEKLRGCLDSLREQTYKDIEIILIDDGSSDRSAEICDEYSQKDPRIKTYHIPNSGVSVARNIGINKSNSKYIMFVDSDDKVESIIVEKLINKAITDDLDFVMCGYKRVYIKNNKIINMDTISCKAYSGGIKGFLNSIENYVGIPLLQSPCWKLFKKSIIAEYNVIFSKEMSYGEDTEFVYKYLKHIKNVATIDEELYNYYIYGNKTLSHVFREDKYEVNLYLVQQLKSLIENHELEINELFFQTQVCGFYVSYLGEIYNNNFEKKQRYQFISKANNMIETKEAFNESFNRSWQYKKLAKFIIHNNTRKIDRFFKIKEYFRKNFSWVFKISRLILQKKELL